MPNSALLRYAPAAVASPWSVSALPHVWPCPPVDRGPEWGQQPIQGGESEYVVEADVPVLAYDLADRTLLKNGAAVVTIAVEQPDRSLLTSRVTTQRDGVKLPM